jgi:glutamate N-acetyltransferase/amino-acid N-acetyltransferase
VHVNETDTKTLEIFRHGLQTLMRRLATLIVRDGEGATKFITIDVSQAGTRQEALDVAYTVAHSPLVKTAFFASDPNWGRILAAVGRAGIADLDVSLIRISLDEVLVVENGARSDSYNEKAGQMVMDREEITIHIKLGRGDRQETVWTTDLSHEYVKINAEYRT